MILISSSAIDLSSLWTNTSWVKGIIVPKPANLADSDLSLITGMIFFSIRTYLIAKTVIEDPVYILEYEIIKPYCIYYSKF